MTQSRRVFSFYSGPAVRPQPVLRQAQEELLDWRGRGYSVMETSHRTEVFVAVMKEMEALPMAGSQTPVGFTREFQRRNG